MNLYTTLTLKPSDAFKSEFSVENLNEGITAHSDGFALFGPWIDLPRGVWEITIVGDLTCSSKNCIFEVTTNDGLTAIFNSQLTNSNGVICKGTINAHFPLKKLELRIFVTAQSFVKITSIELTKRSEQLFLHNLDILFNDGRTMDVYPLLGLRLILDKSSLVDRQLIVQGAWEEAQLSYLKLLISRCKGRPEKKLFLDIGAYFGLYSMLMSRTTFFDEIKAYEVDSFNYRQMLGNLLLNDIDCQIQTYFLAASDKDGEGRFVPSTEHPTMNRAGMALLLPWQSNEKETVVQTRTLDGLIKPRNQIVFGKIDTEGHEIRVINGMAEILTSNKCVFQIECLTSDKLDELNKIMTHHRYTLINQIEADYYYSNFL